MASAPHIFGIRHHGPGSARRLLEALGALRPSVVLIEGPSDASDLLPMLADAAMAPPVALLTYAADDPARAIFWPFATYSPEYQAACWAARNGDSKHPIRLPEANLSLALLLVGRKMLMPKLSQPPKYWWLDCGPQILMPSLALCFGLREPG